MTTPSEPSVEPDDLDPIVVYAGPSKLAGPSVDVAVAEYVHSVRLFQLYARVQAEVSVRDAFEKFVAGLDELRRTLARGPRWVDIRDAVSLFGVPEKIIKEWTRQGFVRKAKLGPTFQSKTIYNAEDLHDVLCRFAAGKPPINALGKAN